MAMTNKKYDTITVETIINECLFDEYGWHKELWYDKTTKKFTFSGWMTQNSWNESEDENDVKVTTFDSIDLTDNDTISHIDELYDLVNCLMVDEEKIKKAVKFYKVKYENGYINPDFPLSKWYVSDKVLDEYGIMNESEAIDVLVNIAENDSWFEDDLEAIDNVENDDYQKED